MEEIPTHRQQMWFPIGVTGIWLFSIAQKIHTSEIILLEQQRWASLFKAWCRPWGSVTLGEKSHAHNAHTMGNVIWKKYINIY